MYGSPVRRHSLHTHVMREERGNCSEFLRAACRSRVGENLVGYVRMRIHPEPPCMWHDARPVV